MNSKFYDVIIDLYEEGKTFYLAVAEGVRACKIIGLSGDYVIIDTKISDRDVTVHMHYSQIQIIFKDD